MKLALVCFLALVASATCVNLSGLKVASRRVQLLEPRTDVNSDVQDLINMLPISQIQDTVNQYINTNEEVKGDWAYATSEGFKALLAAMESSPEFLNIRQQLAGKGLDVPRFVNMVHDIIGMEHISYRAIGRNFVAPKEGGLRSLLQEVKNMIPMTQIKLAIGEKYVFHWQFRDLANLIKGDGFLADVTTLANSQSVVAMTDDAQAHGVDMQAIYDFIHGTLRMFTNLN